MDLLKTYRGTIVKFAANKAYGFIETENEKHVFFHLTHYRKLIDEEGRKLGSGTIEGYVVEFNVHVSRAVKGRFEAFGLRFLHNPRYAHLLTAGKDAASLGTLIKRGNRYYIKDKSTGLEIKVKVHAMEIERGQVYDARINKTVPYGLYAKANKMKAYLTDRKFPMHYYLLKEAAAAATPLTARITRIVSDGYFASLFHNKLQTFISIPKGYGVIIPYQRLDELEVIVRPGTNDTFIINPMRLTKIKGDEHTEI
jgi:cold shock CspA family protein